MLTFSSLFFQGPSINDVRKKGEGVIANADKVKDVMCIYDVCQLPAADKGREMVKKSENYAYTSFMDAQSCRNGP